MLRKQSSRISSKIAPRCSRSRKRKSFARTTLLTGVKRWRPDVRHAEASKLVNEALETLLRVKMKEKKTSRWRKPIWIAEQQ